MKLEIHCNMRNYFGHIWTILLKTAIWWVWSKIKLLWETTCTWMHFNILFYGQLRPEKFERHLKYDEKLTILTHLINLRKTLIIMRNCFWYIWKILRKTGTFKKEYRKIWNFMTNLIWAVYRIYFENWDLLSIVVYLPL